MVAAAPYGNAQNVEARARGDGPLARRVRLRVDRVLWRRAGAPEPPRTLGGTPWYVKEGDVRRWHIGPYWQQLGRRGA